MSVKVARSAGFCMGVRRAMNIVLDTVNRGTATVCTLGPLIHNQHVVELLRTRGVRVIDDVSQSGGSTVVIRAHGVPPDVREHLERVDATVRDATCPHVTKVQSIVKRHAADGYQVLIVGDSGHAEVNGLLGYASGKGIVISTLDDLNRLGALDKVCVVGQTTQDAAKFDEIAREARRRYQDCIVFDTLCDSTHQRQAELRDMAKHADAVVVVGGYDSANTKRLADIARSTDVPTFHVESAEGLDTVPVGNFKDVVVTAGASTPNWLIRGVVEAIERAQQQRMSLPARVLRQAAKFLQDSGILVSGSTALLTYASCRLQEIPVQPDYLILAFSYVFAMQHLLYFTDRAAAAFNEPARAAFYEKHKALIVAVGALGILVALGFSIALGLDAFGLVLLASAAGIAYNVAIVPERIAARVRVRRLKDIPASKDAFTALAWTVVTVAVPLVNASVPITGRSAVAFFFVFVIAFIRSVIVDVQHIQGDRIVGKETIPIVIGKNRTKVLLGVLAAGLAIVLFWAAQVGIVSTLGYWLIACVVYACTYLYLYHERITFQTIPFETVVDSNFGLAGLVALMWSMTTHG